MVACSHLSVVKRMTYGTWLMARLQHPWVSTSDLCQPNRGLRLCINTIFKNLRISCNQCWRMLSAWISLKSYAFGGGDNVGSICNWKSAWLSVKKCLGGFTSIAGKRTALTALWDCFWQADPCRSVCMYWLPQMNFSIVSGMEYDGWAEISKHAYFSLWEYWPN